MKALSDIKVPPAYRDTNLQDRSGELWEDIPGLDACYRISNFGRIKRLEREIFDSQGGAYMLAAKIITPSINFSPNKITHDRTHRLQVVLQLNNRRHSFMVHRLVYCCFVKSFPLDDMSVNVVPKNGDGFDIRPDNLLLLPLQQRCQRTYNKGRLLSPFALGPENITKAVTASSAITSKEISQYNEWGRLITTFKSIMDAARKTGISHGNISSSVHRSPGSKAGGFFWRLGHKRKLDLKQIRLSIEKGLLSYRKKTGTIVTQFDLKGRAIACYDALSEAARINHISHKSISTHLKGITKHAGGFRWKLGRHI